MAPETRSGRAGFDPAPGDYMARLGRARDERDAARGDAERLRAGIRRLLNLDRTGYYLAVTEEDLREILGEK